MHRSASTTAKPVSTKPIGFWIVALTLFSSTAFGQVLGSISGTVHDPTTAIIPEATLTVINTDTGLSRSVSTDERGYYRALSLPVGRYDVKVEKQGFRTLVRFGIDLVVAQDAVVDIDMQIGANEEHVEVAGQAAPVNVATTSIAGLVGARAIKDLPLNGRSFDNLITLN